MLSSYCLFVCYSGEIQSYLHVVPDGNSLELANMTGITKKSEVCVRE